MRLVQMAPWAWFDNEVGQRRVKSTRVWRTRFNRRVSSAIIGDMARKQFVKCSDLTRTALICAALWVAGLDYPATAESPDFGREILPILTDNCFDCHGPDKAARKADLRLDTEEGIASVIDVEILEDSELLRRLMSSDEEDVMPPPSAKRTLTSDQLDKLRRWIHAGATWDQHWAFQVPQRPALPRVSDPDWPRNPIDAFVMARLDQVDIDPNSPATRERWLRRVTLDLTGLPPTIEQLDAFLQDEGPEADERVVQELLASPRFGERMAMDWLDAARYADTNGYQGDRERTMWPWRDWVVNALNSNQPYDQFTTEQIAGDLISNASFSQRLATGFCRNHMINGEGGRIPEENRVEYIFDQIETVGTVWLGLTMQCCRCHDHKFDPLAQSEYFQLFAYFNRTPITGAGGDGQMPPAVSVPSQVQQQLLSQLESDKGRLASELRRQEGDLREVPEAVLAIFDADPHKRTDEQWSELESYFDACEADVADREAYANATKRFRAAKRRVDQVRGRIPRVMVMQDLDEETRKTFILEKGLYNQPREQVESGTPAVLAGVSPPGGSRLDLARWLVSGEHPLVARVTVNRIWQTFFGSGLVKTVEDFGVQGEKPSHPHLLDWLATELIRSNWDTKHIVRLIVTSATYRQSAAATTEQREGDPENRLLARGPRHRLPSWMIRDQALAASGLLVGELGGPPVKPYQPPGVWAEATFGKKRYRADSGGALYRRSLYVFWRRIVGPTMFFDNAKRQTCSVRTANTNTPLHALVTLNDITYVEAARQMAVRVMTDFERPNDRISQAFRLGTSRRPSSRELQLLVARLHRLKEHYAAVPQEAKSLTQVGESPISARFAPSDLAAYSAICLAILNLDESLNR